MTEVAVPVSTTQRLEGKISKSKPDHIDDLIHNAEEGLGVSHRDLDEIGLPAVDSMAPIDLESVINATSGVGAYPTSASEAAEDRDWDDIGDYIFDKLMSESKDAVVQPRKHRDTADYSKD